MGIRMNILGIRKRKKGPRGAAGWVGAACRRTGTERPCRRCTEGFWGLEMIQPQRLHHYFFFLPHAPSQQSLVYLKSLKLKVRKALLKGTLAPCVSLSGFCRGVEVVI